MRFSFILINFNELKKKNKRFFIFFMLFYFVKDAWFFFNFGVEWYLRRKF